MTVTGGLPGATVTRRDRAHLGTTVLGASEIATPPAAGSAPLPAHHSAGRLKFEPVFIWMLAILALSGGAMIGRHRRNDSDMAGSTTGLE